MLTVSARGLWDGVTGLGRRRLVREAIWIAVGQGTVAAAGLVSLRLFTELAPRSVFGAANLLIGMLGLAMQTLVAPILQTQLRYYIGHKDAGHGDRYTWLIGWIAACATLATIAIMTAVLLIWPSARVGAGQGVVGWLMAWIAISTWRALLISRVQAERQQKRYALWLASEALLVMFCTAGVLFITPTVEGYIAGQASGTAIAALAFGRLPAWQSASKSEDTALLRSEAWRQIVSYGVPFGAFALVGWLSNLSDRYVLAANLDVAAVGQYVASFAIASRLPMLLAGSLNNVFQPALFEAESRHDRPRARALFTVWLAALGAISATVVLAVVVLGNAIAGVLLAANYREGTRAVMSWIAFGYALFAIAQAMESRLLSLGISRVLIWTKLVGAVANIALAIALIPMLGMIGAAVANAAGQGLQFVACLWAWRSLATNPTAEPHP